MNLSLKRILSFVLALVMVVVMLPSNVLSIKTSAAETTNVAKIGDTEYATLQAAINAAKSGDTVTLLKDITLGTYVLGGSDAAVTINKDITLDGNGKTFTSKAGRAINIDVAGKVEIKNLTIKQYCGRKSNDQKRCIDVINQTATVKVTGCTLEMVAHSNRTSYVAGVQAATGANHNITIDGCNIKTIYGVVVYAAGSEIDIKNTNISNALYGAWINAACDIDVVNSTITTKEDMGTNNLAVAFLAQAAGVSVTADENTTINVPAPTGAWAEDPEGKDGQGYAVYSTAKMTEQKIDLSKATVNKTNTADPVVYLPNAAAQIVREDGTVMYDTLDEAIAGLTEDDALEDLESLDGTEITVEYVNAKLEELGGDFQYDENGEAAPVKPPIEVSTKAELDAAIAGAQEGDVIKLIADIKYGTDQLKIEKAITLDLGGNTLTTGNAYGGISVKNGATIKNGNIVHVGTVAAIKVWNAKAFKNLTIEVTGVTDTSKVIGGIVLQEGSTTRVDSIKNVTIKGAGLTNGIQTYNCGTAKEDVIGSMENVNIDAVGVAMNIYAPCGTATNCTFKGGNYGIEIWIKGTYNATLDLVNCTVEGGETYDVFVHDEYKEGVVNNGTLTLTADAATGLRNDRVNQVVMHGSNLVVENQAAAQPQVFRLFYTNYVKTNYVAQIGETGYATLEDAFAAAKNGETVELIAATYGDIVIPAEFGGTLAIGTCTIQSITNNSATAKIVINGNVVVENPNGSAITGEVINISGNGTLTAIANGDHAYGIGGDDTKSITIENVHILKVQGGHYGEIGSDTKYYKDAPEGGAGIGSGSNGAVITLTNVTIDEALGGSKAAGIGARYWTGVTVNITGCEISYVEGGATAAGIGGSRVSNGATASEAVTINIKNSTITAVGGVYAAGIGSGYDTYTQAGQPICTINIDGSTINATGGKYAAGVGTGYHNAGLAGEIKNSTITAASGEKVYKDEYTSAQDIGFGVVNLAKEGSNNDSCIIYNGTKITLPGNVAQIGETKYKTLAEALAAAKAGDTITFLADITEDVTVSTKVTIDGAGKTYTGKMTLKADTTIKNVNFDGKGYNGYAITTRGANYLTIEDCTAKNYGYGFLQTASGTALTTVKDVTISDMNYGVKIDYSGAVVLENVDITANVAAVLNSNYGEKTITIKNSKLNILGTWKRNDTTKTTYVFEGANTVGEFKTEAALDTFKLALGATVTAPNTITATATEAGYSVKYVDGKYVVKANMVAIGEETYASLAEALAAAKAGDTITFLADITEDVTISKAITIDGAGKTYTGAMTLKADTTIKNVNFDGKGYNGYAVETRGANYVTIEACTAKNYGYGFLQTASGTALTTVKDVTISDMNYGVKIDYSNAVVLENVDITANVAAVLNSNYGEKTVTIKNSKLNILGTWKRNDTTKTTYVFEGANTVGEFKTEAALDTFKLALGATVTAPNTITATATEAGYSVKYVDGKYVVKANMVAIGEETYASLAEALAAAKAGDTITFLADITEDVTISKNVTIDGAGKTYTGKMTLKADTTIKNVNFDGKGYNGYAVETRGANYVTIEACTAKNYGYGFLQTASGTVLTTVKNVTISDMNYGVKIDYSNAVVLENVDITANVAAVLNSNYGEKTITIKNSKLNILGTWKRNDTTKTTYVFEGANTVGEFKTEAALDTFKLADLTSTLTAPEGLSVLSGVETHYVTYSDGTYKLAQYVARNVDTGVYYADVSDALAAAQSGETVVLLVDGQTEAMLMISAGVTFNLNGHTITAGNVLSFGNVIDNNGTTDGLGGIIISNDRTKAFVQLQQNNTYLPLYDKDAGCYRFYAYSIVLGKLAQTNDTTVRFRFNLRLSSEYAYQLLADTANAGVEMAVTLKITGFESDVVYIVSSDVLQNYANEALAQIDDGKNPNEVSKVMALYVGGIDTLASGTEIAFIASVNSETGVYSEYDITNADQSRYLFVTP